MEVQPARPGDRPRIFVTGMWGFTPSREGYVGFTNRSIRDRFITDYQPGDLMLVVGQKGLFSEKRDVGRVLGLVDLDPVPIHERERFSKENYEAKVARFGPDRWQHALPIRRAWELATAIKAKFMAPETCDARNARAIGATYLPLNDDEIDNVLSARMRPTLVYGADNWNAYVEDTPDTLLGRDAVSRGPAPSYGTFEVTRDDGPTSLYVMTLRGCVDALFPRLLPATRRNSVIKVGISAEPDRRQVELNWGFPPGAEASWTIARKKLHPNGATAYEAEQTFLKYLESRGLTIGGEFACVPEGEFETLMAIFVDRTVGFVKA